MAFVWECIVTKHFGYNYAGNFVKAMQKNTNNCYVVCFPADLCWCWVIQRCYFVENLWFSIFVYRSNMVNREISTSNSGLLVCIGLRGREQGPIS